MIFFFLILSWSGFTILRRTTAENRFQILAPAGVISGVAIYIFLINLIAHIIKGVWGFYLALVILILLAILIKTFIPTESFILPKKRNLLLFILSLIIFIPFLLITSAQGPANTADSFMHYSLAAVFQRGDYPPHVPWQPDYISYYHLGVAEILGVMRTITSASYELLFSFLELIILGCIATILPWFYKTKKTDFLLFFSISAFGIISLGSFWFAWPISVSFPQTDLFTWLKHLPTLADVPANGYGTQTNLLSFMLFPHRILSIAFFIISIILILSPRKNYLSVSLLAVLIAVIALTDESTFVATVPAIFFVCFFIFFKKSFLKSFLFIGICFSIVILQGGILSYLVFNPNHTKENDILIFPPDQTGPEAMYENYRSSRLNSLNNSSIKTDATFPLHFFNVGIIWRITIISIITIFLLNKRHNEPILVGIFILCLASFLAMIEFVVIVPKGYLHANGDRFLGLSYYFSGLAIIYLIYFSWENYKPKSELFKLLIKILKNLIIWILLITVIPSTAILFPLQTYNWYKDSAEVKDPFYTWIKQNIPLEDRILLLVSSIPIASANVSLITQEGAFTPIWAPQIRSFYGVDTSPTFFDIFYTLNPSLLKLLKLKYLIVSNDFVSQLPKERINDLKNKLFFEPISSPKANGLTILKIKDKYIENGKEFEGTFTELQKIAPLEGSYFIENPPAIEESIYRSTRLILADRKLYFNKSVAFYNYQIDVTLKYYGESTDHYDYLILGKNTDPESICHCKTELFWFGLGENLKIWKTEKTTL